MSPMRRQLMQLLTCLALCVSGAGMLDADYPFRGIATIVVSALLGLLALSKP